MLRRATALLTLLALVAGCAAPARKPTPPSAPLALAPPPPSPTPLPPVPPASIGPRADAPVAEAPKVSEPAAPLPPPPPRTTPEVPPAQRGRLIVLNFDNADIETIIQAASEIVGFNYVLAPDVRGKVTVQTSGRIPQEDVFGVLLAILEVHGFTAIKAGSLYKIMRIEGARERAVPTIVGRDPDPNRTTDEIITQIIPLRFSSVTDLSSLLRPLISTRGTLIAHRETNVLIITDTASNLSRLLDIVRLVDVQVAQEELQIVPIRFADATQLAQILNQLFASGRIRALTPVPGVPATLAAPPQPGVVAPLGPGAPQQPGATAERQPLILPEQRSNSLIIHAKKHELETIRRLIAQLDVNIYGARRVFIYYAENTKAKDLSATLNAIYGREALAGTQTTGTTGRPPAGTAPPPLPPTPPPPTGAGGPVASVGDASFAEGQVRFIADEVTNSIIVTTYPRLWQEIEGTIKQLDKMPRQVLIEVLVAEITLTDDTRLGIDWALRTGKVGLANATTNLGVSGALPTASGPGGTSTGALVAPNMSIPSPGLGTFFGPIGAGLTAFTFQSERFFAIMNMMATDNRINIISNPHVMTSENKKAVINVSRSVPIITSQQTSAVSTPGTTAGTTSTTIATGGVNQTVEYRDAGVILTVTPRIGERGTVALDVKQEVNAVGPNFAPTNSPSFDKREAETSVVLLNNQTLVLGGLLQDKVTIDDIGIPFLKNIPIIGFFFGFKGRKVEKTELLMLITPRVIGTALDAVNITDQMRRATPELNDAIKRSPRQPSNAPAPGAPAPSPSGGEPAPATPAPEAAAPPPPAPQPAAPAPIPAPTR
jgi:general secretion pathway protein D